MIGLRQPTVLVDVAPLRAERVRHGIAPLGDAEDRGATRIGDSAMITTMPAMSPTLRALRLDASRCSPGGAPRQGQRGAALLAQAGRSHVDPAALRTASRS